MRSAYGLLIGRLTATKLGKVTFMVALTSVSHGLRQ